MLHQKYCKTIPDVMMHLTMENYILLYCGAIFRSRLSWNRQPKMVQYKDKKVFGVPLLLNITKTGCALPKTILHAISYLRKNGRLIFLYTQFIELSYQGLATKGIFRKAAYRSRVSSLKELAEANPGIICSGDYVC